MLIKIIEDDYNYLTYSDIFIYMYKNTHEKSKILNYLLRNVHSKIYYGL